jgi:hypothetical protein
MINLQILFIRKVLKIGKVMFMFDNFFVKKEIRADEVGQVVEYLPSKLKPPVQQNKTKTNQNMSVYEKVGNKVVR